MEEKEFQVEIITPERVRYRGGANLLQLPTTQGIVGILKNHAPYLAIITPGELLLRYRDREILMAVGEGFVKFSENKAVVLVGFAEKAEDIDREAAGRIIKEEAESLKNARTEEERERHSRLLAHARARVKVAGG